MTKLNNQLIYKLTNENFVNTVYKNEITTISTYSCKLAEVTYPSGVALKIWYTEDIPISAGPFMMGNFPGLILKIEAHTYVLYTTNIIGGKNNSAIMKIDPKLPIYENDVLVKGK